MWTEGLNASNVCVLKCERICVDGAFNVELLTSKTLHAGGHSPDET